mmetsp:Transcript_14561/g.13160  ORF Transcript_14561/g.13160 Transcript_14561/m.13160 type:complete len:1479 (-) Transcript_14561:145-4581(-)
MIRLYILIELILLTLINSLDISVFLNGTGATFPANVYTESTFAYSFIDSSVSVTYYPLGSTTGKCNIMGYWHTGNSEIGAPSSSVIAKDTLICTDACTVATCGFSSASTPRPDRLTRNPLNDFGASDSILKTADYTLFPDIVMYPAVGGAVVPIYNIPELTMNQSTLILSRSAITNIFLGNIRNWNDSRILSSNNKVVQNILSSIDKPITFVVRTDSSGTSEIFSSSLSSFDPARSSVSYDSSFYTSVGFGSTPSWCGTLTDEVQYITINGCDSNLSVNDKSIEIYIVGFDYNLRKISFQCDISAISLAYLYSHSNGNNKTVYLDKSSSGSTVTFKLGYLGSVDSGLNKPNNWYQPFVLNTTSNYLSVSISTLQEGGYKNSHYSYATKPKLPEVRSLWIHSGYTFNFTISYSDTVYPSSLQSFKNVYLNVTTLKTILNVITNSLISSVTYINHKYWYEYKITFNTPTVSSFIPKNFNVMLISDISDDFIPIAMTTLTTSNNFPIFYNKKTIYGFSNSGIYTCYKREQNYLALSYRTGNLNPGVASEVDATPYSIGYSVLGEALQFNLSKAKMINYAGTVVTASASSVAYAVLENGGNLNAYNAANLVDGKSQNVWPMSGYTYFLLRTKDHIGDCSRRKQAMEFLYDFYHDSTVSAIAARHGFATLPEFIRDIIVNHMINNVYCKDSNTYALEKYRVVSDKVYTTSMLYLIIQLYLSVYNNVDSSASFSITEVDNSKTIWDDYTQNPEQSVGAFVSFSDLYTKQSYYLSTDEPIIVTPFTHYSVVFIYHLNSFPTSVSLKITKEIIIGILSNQITHWNDSLIQRANFVYKSYLPYQRIIVVTQSNSSDNNVVLSRFLAINNETIRNQLDLSIHGNDSIPFHRLLDPEYHIDVKNSIVDRYVTHFDGTIGYYNLLYGLPNSYISSYCHDPDCNDVVYPGSDSGNSLNICQLDDSTVLNMGININSYDLMLSNNHSCYPIAGTIDFITYSKNNSDTCEYTPTSNSSSITRSITNQRIRFSAWLFNGSVVTNPLSSNYESHSTPSIVRLDSYTNICNIECNDESLGYKYCNYRDCSWTDGDYYQTVLPCDSKTQTRTITYTLYPDRSCLDKNPLSSLSIECTYVSQSSSVGIVAYIVCGIGMTMISALLILTFYHKDTKIIKKSQPIFIYTFLFGSIFLCGTIVAYIGPNNDTTCLLRPWLFNLSSTIMFAPLIMKLRRIDVLFNNPKLKKIKVTDRLVLMQVLSILFVDVILLIIWTVAEKPEVNRITTTKYANVYDPVEDLVCSTGLSNFMEIILVVYKAILLVVGVYLAVTTWKVPSDLSEAKYFAVAIYNITMVGGLAYFLSDFLIQTTSVVVGVFLQCLGMFVCAILACLVIIIPKLLVAEGIRKVSPSEFKTSSAGISQAVNSNKLASNRANVSSSKSEVSQTSAVQIQVKKTENLTLSLGSPSLIKPSMVLYSRPNDNDIGKVDDDLEIDQSFKL